MNRRLFFQGSVAAAVSAALSSQPLGAAALQALTAVHDDVRAIAGAGDELIIEKAAIAELGDALRGNLLLPGNALYDTARHVRNASIDKYPALIVQPSGVADIQHAVTFARERGLLTAVKCGGHSFSGKSTCDGGMLIDLSTLRHVRVDRAGRRAHVAGGSLLGDLDHEAMAHGLVTTAGTVSHTGVGGLTLGGGFGRLARRFGLALDNVRSVDIVTADGQLRHASPEENADLYWGVRGGGGNFGVVTNFEFELHPMQRTVIAGEAIFPLSRARDVLSFYGEFCESASDELYFDLIMTQPEGGQPGIIMVYACHSGAPDDAERELAPLAKLGKPIANTIGPLDYVAAQRAWDEGDPRAVGSYLKSGFISELPGDLVNALVDNFEPAEDRGTTLFFQIAGGAIGRVPSDATAFPHRYASHTMFTVSSWRPDHPDPAKHMNATRRYWGELERFTHGYYTNETADEGQQAIDRNYQGNLGRLVAVKNRYDPTNLFRLNANVRPTTRA